MTWASLSIFGQTTWAHRVFPLLLSTIAWLVLYGFFLSNRTRAWIAFTLCACCVLNPLLTVYERTACNDTLMASVLLIGYVVARKKGFLSPFLGGCVFGLGLWVKESIWVLVALGLGGALTTPITKDRWRRAGCFAGGFVLSALVSWAGIRLLIYQDAIEQGVTVQKMLAISNSSYPLPNVFDWVSTLKGISSFPRFPTDGLLGIWIPLVIVLPALLLLRQLTDGPIRWNGRLLMYLTLPAYAAAIMILPVYYAHYFIPIISFIPVLWFEARLDLKRWSGRRPWVAGALLLLCLSYILYDFDSFHVIPEKATDLNPFLADAFYLPAQIMWAANGWFILKAALVLALLGICGRQKRLSFVTAVGIVLAAFGVADICYSLLPASEGYLYSPILSNSMKVSALLLQMGAIVLFFVVWTMPQIFRRSVWWPLLLVVLLVAGIVIHPVWRNGTSELVQRNHLHRVAVAELAKIVPENAVVFGERAPQLFLSLKSRVAAAANGNPVPLVLAMHRKYPARPLFAVLDPENHYHYDDYMAAQNDITMQQVAVLQLPGFCNNKPTGVLLVKLDVHPDGHPQ